MKSVYGKICQASGKIKVDFLWFRIELLNEPINTLFSAFSHTFFKMILTY